METRNKSNTEFRNEVIEALAQHASQFDLLKTQHESRFDLLNNNMNQVTTSLQNHQNTISELQALSLHHSSNQQTIIQDVHSFTKGETSQKGRQLTFACSFPSASFDRSHQQLKLLFPKFCSDEPTGWVYKAEQFFEFQNIVNEQRVQVTTVAAYQEAFEGLSHRVDGLPEPFLVGCFIAGLRDDIRLDVKTKQAKTLGDTIGVARLVKERNLLQRKGKRFARSTVISRPLSTTNSGVLGPPLASKPINNTAPSLFRRITNQEARERREKGLCFYCDEKFIPGHRCQRPQLFMIEDSTPADTDTNEDCTVDIATVESFPEISFHAIAITEHPQTIRVIGKLKNKDVTMLIDGGSTHNFIDQSIVSQFGLQEIRDKTFQVMVANREKIFYGGWRTMACDFWSNRNRLQKSTMSFIDGGIKRMFQGIGRAGLEALSNKDLFNLQQTGLFLHITMTEHVDSTATYSSDLAVILDKFSHVFDTPTALPPNRSHDHCILLQPNNEPVSVHPYRYPYYQKTKIEKMVKELLESGLVRPSNSPFSSPVLLVKKVDGTWRFCVDFRALNHITVKDKYHILIVDELLDELHGARFFTKLDLRSGYHQIRVQESDIQKTAFHTHEGHYEFVVMSFGLTNALATFQSLMNDLFRPYLQKGVEVDPSKIQAMVDWPEPTTVKGVRGFLGLARYYRKFISGFGNIATPLTYCLGKEGFRWGINESTTFNKLKHALTSPPVLRLPDFSQCFFIECDAYGTGICIILIQQGQPTAFFSKALKGSSLALSTYEKRDVGHCQSHPYDYVVEYKKGPENKGADFLFRKDEINFMAVSLPQPDWWMHGVWFKGGKVYLNPSSPLIPSVLAEHHSSPFGSHFGYHITLARIQELLQPLSIPIKIWTEVSMDFVEGLPPSLGNTVIMVVLDRLSKYAHFVALKHPFTAITVAKSFIANVVKLHGIPVPVVSDRDKGTQLNMSSSYHPQSDGQTEVVNWTLEQYLRCFTGDQPHKWVDWLPWPEFSYNTAIHSSTKISPFEAVYGISPPNVLSYVPGTTRVQVVDEYLRDKDSVLQELRHQLVLARDRTKTQPDKHRREGGEVTRLKEAADVVVVVVISAVLGCLGRRTMGCLGAAGHGVATPVPRM
ncbi:uncharacterized protein [Populus alba]|uniref:uncharacterized protein n=1 Tax=Populus alba TaxID=43335 RepID=UPI003CC7053A